MHTDRHPRERESKNSVEELPGSALDPRALVAAQYKTVQGW